jgi:hypothetical protein
MERKADTMKTNTIWSYALVFGVSIGVTLFLAACQQPAPPAPVDREASVTEPAVKAPKMQEETDEETLISVGTMDVIDEHAVEVSTTEPQELSKPVTMLDSVIGNASFEDWKDNAPSGWGTLGVDSEAGTMVVACEDSPYGSLAVKFVPAEAVPSIYQSFKLPAEYVGKTMKLSAAIKSSEEGMTKVNLYYMLDGSRKAILLKDQGMGEWTVDTAVFTLPQTADLESLNILIGLREGAEEASCVDDIRLEIVE